MTTPDACLIVIDNDSLVKRAHHRGLSGILRALGHGATPILTAESGADALELVAREDQKLGGKTQYFLLTDGDMPGMNGPDVIRRLDGLLQHRLLMRTICSANSEYEKQAEQLTAFFLLKPCDMGELKSLLNIYFAQLD